MDRGPKICILGTLAICVTLLLIFMFVGLAVAQPVGSTRTRTRILLNSESGNVVPWNSDAVSFKSVENMALYSSSFNSKADLSVDGTGGSASTLVRDDAPQAQAMLATTGISDRAADQDQCSGYDSSIAPPCAAPEASKEWIMLQVAHAVGRVYAADNRCSGVVLGNSKSAVYFLTASRCLPEKSSDVPVSVQLTNCQYTGTFGVSSVSHANKEFKYAILVLDMHGVDVGLEYGFVRLRRTPQWPDTPAFIPNFTLNRGKRVSTQYNGAPINVQFASDTHTCGSPSATSMFSYYAVAWMEKSAIGAPVIRSSDFIIIALHLCRGSTAANVNIGLASSTIASDLQRHGKLLGEFI